MASPSKKPSESVLKSEPSSPVASTSKRRHQSIEDTVSDDEVVTKKIRTEEEPQEKDKISENTKRIEERNPSSDEDDADVNAAGPSTSAVKNQKRKWTSDSSEEDKTPADDTCDRPTKKPKRKSKNPVSCEELCEDFFNLGIDLGGRFPQESRSAKPTVICSNLMASSFWQRELATEYVYTRTSGASSLAQDVVDNPFSGIEDELALPELRPPELTCVASSHAVISEEQLTDVCSVFDRPSSVSMLPHRRTSCRTIALVEYADLEATERALTLSGRARVNGGLLYVERLRDY